MLILKIVSIIAVAAVLTVIVRQQRAEYAPFVVIAAGIIIFTLLIPEIESTLGGVRTILDGTGVEGGYIEILFKTLGICVLTQISSDICRDANESALATKAEIAGKIAVLAVAMPMITSIAQISVELINQ